MIKGKLDQLAEKTKESENSSPATQGTTSRNLNSLRFKKLRANTTKHLEYISSRQFCS